MSETRKLAAILVADVVGYSRLAGADEQRRWRILWETHKKTGKAALLAGDGGIG